MYWLEISPAYRIGWQPVGIDVAAAAAAAFPLPDAPAVPTVTEGGAESALTQARADWHTARAEQLNEQISQLRAAGDVEPAYEHQRGAFVARATAQIAQSERAAADWAAWCAADADFRVSAGKITTQRLAHQRALYAVHGLIELARLYTASPESIELWYAANSVRLGLSPRASLLGMAVHYGYFKICSGVRLYFDRVVAEIMAASDPAYLPVLEINPIWQDIAGNQLPYRAVLPKTGHWRMNNTDVLQILAYEMGVPYSTVLGWSEHDKLAALRGRELARVTAQPLTGAE